MANKGLYYYKLVSPYAEDVTKDCKLTINEIDSNFKSLKDNDIKDVTVNEDKKELVFHRNDGDDIKLSLSEVNPEFNLEYNDIDGVIEIEYNNDRYSISGLITKENLSKEILTKVYSDDSLVGVGTSKLPLSISPVYKTGFHKPVKKIIDTTVNERVPREHLGKGDRYVVLEEVSDYGLLYNFDGVRHINRLLEKTGWRVPTKNDWDNMLNAIEPCEFRNHNSALNNRVLGKLAGKLLKSQEDWRCPDFDDEFRPKPPCGCDAEDFDDSAFDVDFKPCKPIKDECKKPRPRPIAPMGDDVYGMGILPAGYGYFSRPMQFANFGSQGAFWTTDMLYDSDVYTKVFTERDGGVLQIGERPSVFLSIRLIKDYDGVNFNGVENILGQNYGTVLMPSLNNPDGYAIWTAQNLNFADPCITTVFPNDGLGLENRKVYFIYEWDGFKWDKVELTEGESVTVMEGRHPNEVYRIIDNKLENTDDIIIDIVKKDALGDFTEVKARLDLVESSSNTHDEKIAKLEEDIETSAADYEEVRESIVELTAKDSDLQSQIDDLSLKYDLVSSGTSNRVEEIVDSINKVKTELETSINTKTEKLASDIQELNTKVDEKITEFTNKDVELESAIDEESQSREDADTALDERIDDLTESLNTEVEDRESADNALEEKFDGKVDELTESIESNVSDLNDRIDSEVDALNSTIDEEVANLDEKIDGAVDTLTDSIDDEVKNREEGDTELQLTIDEEVASLTKTIEDNHAEVKGLIQDEVETRQEEAEVTDSRLIVLEGKTLVGGDEGCSYDVKTGILTLKAQDDKNTIRIKFSSNYGTIDFN